MRFSTIDLLHDAITMFAEVHAKSTHAAIMERAAVNTCQGPCGFN